MNELTIFNSKEFGDIRIIVEGGVVLFCGSDVARALAYARPTEAVAKHCKGKVKRRTLTAGGMQEMLFITLGNVYRLITNSHMPNAEKFESLVYDEILPSVGKHGIYVTPAAAEKIVADPRTMIAMCNMVIAEQEKNALLIVQNTELIRQNEVLAPMAEQYAEITARPFETNFRDTAKEFGVTQSYLIYFLIDKKLIYRDRSGKLMPYATAVEAGFFRVVECYNKKTDWAGQQTLVTPLGREKIRKMLAKEQNK